MKVWRLLKLEEPTHPLWNMALDEVLLDQKNALPTLRFYRWSKPTLSIGYFQDIPKIVKAFKCEQKGVDVIRRITGGGVVTHGEDLTLSFIIPENNPFFDKNLKKTYHMIHHLYQEALSPLYDDVTMIQSAKGLSPRSTRNCLEEPSDADIAFAGKKTIGSSQRRRYGNLLNQTTMHLPNQLHGAATAIQNQFEQNLQISFKDKPLEDEEIQQVETLICQKYSKPEFSFTSPIHSSNISEEIGSI